MRSGKIKQLFCVQIAAQTCNFTIQLLSVPAYISAWSSSTYGIWLTLMAIPMVVSQFEVGFGPAAEPEIAKALQGGRFDWAANLFWSSIAATMAVALALALVIAMMTVLDLDSVGGGEIGPTEASIIIFSGLGISILSMVIRCLWSLLYASDHQVAADVSVNASFISEGIAAIALLVLVRATPVEIAVTTVIMRLAAVCVMVWLAAAHCDWIGWPSRKLSSYVEALRDLWKPATGYFADPMANLLQTQAIVFIAGQLLGPTAATVVYTHRLLTRVVWHLSSGLRSVTNGELMRLAVAGDTRARYFSLLTASIYFWTGLVSLVGFLIFGPTVMRLWIGKGVDFHFGLFAMFAASAFLGSVLSATKSIASAENLHYNLSRAELLLSLVTALAIALLLWMGEDVNVIGYGSILLMGALCILSIRWISQRFSISLSTTMKELVVAYPTFVTGLFMYRSANGSLTFKK